MSEKISNEQLGELIARSGGIRDAVSEIARELLELRERTRWIPVGERMPGVERGRFMCVVDTMRDGLGHSSEMYYEDGRWCTCRCEERVDETKYVTHWQFLPPLPEAP